MLRSLVLVVFIFSSIIQLQASDPASIYSSLTIPEELKKNAHTVTRDYKQVFEIKTPSSGVLYKKYVVTLLNEESKEDIMYLQYDSDSPIDLFRATLYDAFGNVIRKSNKSDFKDRSAVSDFSIYEDDRVRILTMTHSNYPFTIEFETKQVLKGTMFFNYPEFYIQSFGESVEKSSYEIIAPEKTEVHYRSLNLDLKPLVAYHKNKKITKWAVENLPAIKKERYAPNYMEVLPIVVTSPDLFKFDNYEGSMRSWHEYGRFMYSLAENRDGISDRLRDEIKKLTTGLSSNKEKIQVLYNYLQDNMRYVSVQLGIGGFQPFSAVYVERNKYGDCKALTNFMKSMLKAIDIEAYPALILSGDTRIDYQEDFVMPFFNHVILYVPTEDTWLECTSTSYPVNYIGSSNLNHEVLLITPTGGKLAKTPISTSQENYEIYETTITLDANGGANIQTEIEYGGTLHEYYRSIDKRADAKKQETLWLRNTDIPSPNSLVLKHSSEADKAVAHTNYQVNSAQYAAKAANRLFVPANRISAFKTILKKSKYRKLPLQRQTGYSESSTITFTLPEDYTIESLPAAKNISNEDFGDFQLTFEPTEDGQVILKRKLNIKSFRVAADRFDELRSFYKEISKADNQQFVLVKPQRP